MRNYLRHILFFAILFGLTPLIIACSAIATPEIIVQTESTATDTLTVIQTPTLLPTDTTTFTATSMPPTDTPTATATSTATAIPTATLTDTPTATATNTPTLTPTASPTLPPLLTATPTPQPETSSVVYPPIPSGKGLLYVINFHSDEAQFRFFDHPEEYHIPGKSVAPEGGVLELFLDPGHYRWASVIEFANLRGEGELEIVEGQIHGLGLVQGKVGPTDIVEGFLIGSDPLAPPVTPTPTPIPTPPTPSPGKTTLVIALDRGAEVLVNGQSIIIPQGQRLFLELVPGPQDIKLSFELALPEEAPSGAPSTIVVGKEFTYELPPNSICDWFFMPSDEVNPAKGHGPQEEFTCKTL